MTVAQDVMTPNVNTCQENSPIRKAVELMKREDIGVVPIINSEEELCGIVTDRDICLQVILDNMDPDSIAIADVMHQNIINCEPDEDMEQVVHKMKEAQVKRILVVENRRCIGIITEADIVRNSTSELSASLAQGVYH
jgi:CBS domain-containing protein